MTRQNGGKELENRMNDERLKKISAVSMGLTFRISVTAQAVASLVCALTDHMPIARCLGFVICLQLALYLIIYFFVRRKI